MTKPGEGGVGSERVSRGDGSRRVMRLRSLGLANDASVAQVSAGVPTVSAARAECARVKPERGSRVKSATVRGGASSTGSGETPMGSDASFAGEAGRVGHSPAINSGDSGQRGVFHTKSATPVSVYVSRSVPSPPLMHLLPTGDVSPSHLAVTTRGEKKGSLSKLSKWK